MQSLVMQETKAKAITGFEFGRIPGLLQTEEYAREVIRHSVGVPEGGVESRMAARLARQSLLRRRCPPKFLFFVHEHALRLPVGGPVMHDQLLHLVFATSRPHCTVRVVDTSAGAHAGLSGPFIFLDYAEHEPVVYVENETASLFLENADDIATYRRVVDKLAEVALDEGQSREWLARVASDI